MEKNSLIRRKQSELDLELEKERLLGTFVDGKSNIDFSGLDLDDFGALVFNDELPNEEIEKLIGKPLPLISKEKWLEKKLAKFEATQPKFPQGKYQDLNEIYVKIQQIYFQALRDSSPHIFEDFKLLLPKFRSLFGSEGSKYYQTIRNLKVELVRLMIDFPMYSLINRDYMWGDTKLLFIAAQFALDSALSATPDDIPKPKEMIEARQNAAYGNDLFYRRLTLKIEGFIRSVTEAFKNTAGDEAAILPDFLTLQSYLNDWADRHHLQKDWLIEYAYFFLYQMIKDENTPLSDITIFPLKFVGMHSDTFDFKFRGWLAAKQDVDNYEEELRESFEIALSNHLSRTYSFLELDKQTKFTRPKDFESIKWLIAWNEGASQPQIADFFCKSKAAIDSGIDRLMEYNLPKRKGQRGRKQQLLSHERLAKIKAIKIDENLFDE